VIRPSRLLDPVRAFLAEPRCAVLSTVSAAGEPHQAVLHYMLEDDGLLLNGCADRLWVRHLLARPAASLVVHDAADSQHWVGLKGEARLLREGPDALQDAMAQARRYAEDPEGFRGQRRISFRLVPRRVYEYR
jgi:PPOX class probable F420-dependent enzyme